MCGIAGFLDLHEGLDTYSLYGVLSNMTNTLVHRGPDSSGLWVDPKAGIGLGHRRLGIIDLSDAGKQPMRSQSGRYCIVFNGEVYNFRSLRQDLAAQGVVFKGHSDTEVLLGAIDSWGLDRTLACITGMFSFALWDCIDQRLYLVRDRVGEKPLYYGLFGKVLLFGSELKALRAHPRFSAQIDRTALVQLMRYGYVPTPRSIYEGVYKLAPGSVLDIPRARVVRGHYLTPNSEGGDIYGLAPRRYWLAKGVAETGITACKPRADSLVINDFESLLRSVVRDQLVADVPVGAFLSGGIDSTTVVTIMQQESALPIKTFTIGFDDENFNEAKYASAIAKHLGTDHIELYVRPEQALDVIPSLPELYDEPFADSSQIPTFIVSKLARQHVTVALSGDGGDELFCGYNRYLYAEDVWDMSERLPPRLKHLLAKYLTAISPRSWDRSFTALRCLLPFVKSFKNSNAGGKIHKMALALGADTKVDLYRLLVSYWNDPEELVINGAELESTISSANTLCNARGLLDNLMYWDQLSYLPDNNLVKVDRASMGVSLETRLPLLDHRIVEFAWRLPRRFKVRDRQGKWMLRQLLRKYIPVELIERPKMGFSVPVAQWLRGPLRDWAEELLSAARLEQEGFFNAKLIRERWGQHVSYRRDWNLSLWAVLMFQAWYAQQRTQRRIGTCGKQLSQVDL